MADYIERKTAVQCARDIEKDFADDGHYKEATGANTVLNWLEDLPAADVRPLVLCRDCKHYRLDPIEIGQMVCVKDADEVDGYFSGFLSYPSETWFCADGEKREES